MSEVLEQRIEELEDRVAYLEAQLEGDEEKETGPEYDRFDQPVVDELEPGQSVSISTLHSLYRRHTDIRSDSTLKKRVQGLVARPEFRIGGVGEIIYDPDHREEVTR